MKKVKTAELTGAALDWAVAKCEMLRTPYIVTVDGFHIARNELDTWKPHGLCKYLPSSLWAQGGPIIEREGISWHCGNKSSWHAYVYGGSENTTGPTPLIAAMRCYVAAKMGDTIEIPEELLT